MRVDLVTPRFHPSLGGIEESVLRLAQGLRGRGHDVTVHTMRREDWPERERVDGLDVRRYAATRDRGYYVGRFEPDLQGEVAHLHAYAHQTNDWVIQRRAGVVPLFLSTHHGARFPKPRLAAKVYHALYNRFRGIPNLNRLDGVLVPTAYDAMYFADRGVDPTRIHVVPSGADDAAFDRHAPWAPPGVAPGFALYLGRLHEEKGLGDLLAAHEGLSRPLPLVLAGRDEGFLQTIDVDAVGRKGVHVVSPVDPEQRFGLLAACRFLALPSRHEGQGIVLAEAWAQSKPVVATRAGALPWVVDDGVDGLLVPLGDVDSLAQAMGRLSSDDALARRLGEAGRRKAQERFRWDKIVARVEALYVEARAKARRA